MLTKQRQQIILDMVNQTKSITVNEIKEATGASESTIRRDLTALDEEGKIIKVFGGAIALEETKNMLLELSVQEKTQMKVDEKKKIAKYAASLIKENDFVFLDAGTTTGYMIDYLHDDNNVTYVTNAVSHAKKLSDMGKKVILTGGSLKKSTEAVVGSIAVLSVSQYNFTKGFFGANGVSKKAGFTTPDVNEGFVKKIAVERTFKKYVLADYSKFDTVTSFTFAQLEDAIIITEKTPSESIASNCEFLLAD